MQTAARRLAEVCELGFDLGRDRAVRPALEVQLIRAASFVIATGGVEQAREIEDGGAGLARVRIQLDEAAQRLDRLISITSAEQTIGLARERS